MSSYDREYILSILRRQEGDFLAKKALAQKVIQVSMTVLGLLAVVGIVADLFHASVDTGPFAIDMLLSTFTLLFVVPFAYTSANRYVSDLAGKADQARRNMAELNEKRDIDVTALSY